MTTAPRIRIRKPRVVSRVPELLRLCAGKKVLHLGCSDMPYTMQRGDDLLHRKLAQVTASGMLWGVDVSEEGVCILRDMGFENVIVGDCESLSAELFDEAFDVILAGELIEHLFNIGAFLESVRNVMRKHTQFVLTTCNAGSFKNFLHSMLREEKVHKDHNYYFSYQTVRQILSKSGFECEEVYYYQEIEGRGIPRLLDRVVASATRVSPVWADGIIARATLRK
jgi:2-polyprenyl-3-methyl-5-hydroxy-6-metoxy-1,4-benzoquinol methylase